MFICSDCSPMTLVLIVMVTLHFFEAIKIKTSMYHSHCKIIMITRNLAFYLCFIYSFTEHIGSCKAIVIVKLMAR